MLAEVPVSWFLSCQKPRVSEPETEGIEQCNGHPLPVLLLPHIHHLAGGALSPHQIAVSSGCCRRQPPEKRLTWAATLSLAQSVGPLSSRKGPVLCSNQKRSSRSLHPSPLQPAEPILRKPSFMSQHGAPIHTRHPPTTRPSQRLRLPSAPHPAAPRAPLRSRVLNTLASATTELPLPGNSSPPAEPSWII